MVTSNNMSGGHWNYMSFKLEERAMELSNVYRFLSVVESELDWGLSCDSCLRCAKKRLGEAMVLFFDSFGFGGDIGPAVSVMTDTNQNQCEICKKS